MFDSGADSGRLFEITTGQTWIRAAATAGAEVTFESLAASRMRMGCPSQQRGADHLRASPSVMGELSEPLTPLCAWLSSHRVSPV